MTNNLGTKVQCIADSFFKNHTNPDNFNRFYDVMLPEADKMLRTYKLDDMYRDDISSRIFENILLKPPVYLTDLIYAEYEQIASLYHGAPSKFWVYNIKGKDGETKTKAYYAPIDKKDGTDGLSFAEVGKLWAIMHRSHEYRVVIRGRVEMVINHLGIEERLKPVVQLYKKSKLGLIEFIATTKGIASELQEIFHLFTRKQLATCPSPFTFDPQKPFLHYFSRVVKTNVQTFHNKNGKYVEISECEMYGSYDDDDRVQMLDKNLTDEHIRSEEEQKEHDRRLAKQKLMIVEYVLECHFPHEKDQPLRDAMADAIFNKADYKAISEKYGWKVESGKNVGADAVGKIKSRVHRMRKVIDAQVNATPYFQKGVNLVLDVYNTYYSDGQLKSSVEICETEIDGQFKTDWHGHYISYYSTGEVKETGKYYAGEKQGNWYRFYRDGTCMKRGKYIRGKQNGNWHHFDANGELLETHSYQNGEETYTETRTIIDKWHRKIVCHNPGSPLKPQTLKKPGDEITAEKLCLKYDDELAHSTIRIAFS